MPPSPFTVLATTAYTFIKSKCSFNLLWGVCHPPFKEKNLTLNKLHLLGPENEILMAELGLKFLILWINWKYLAGLFLILRGKWDCSSDNAVHIWVFMFYLMLIFNTSNIPFYTTAWVKTIWWLQPPIACDIYEIPVSSWLVVTQIHHLGT